MNIAKLNKYIDLYKKQFIGSAYNESDDINERKKRIDFYQSFSKEKLSNISYDERVKMELYYIDHCGLLLDIRIIFDTIYAVIKKDGAK